MESHFYTAYIRKSRRANWWITTRSDNLDRVKWVLEKTLKDSAAHYPAYTWEGIIIKCGYYDKQPAELPCNHKFSESEVIN